MPLLALEPLPPRATRGEVLDLVCAKGGIDRRHVGRIELQGSRAVVEVPSTWAGRLVRALDGEAWRHGRVRARLLDSSGSDEGHFERLRRLLDLEAEAEERQAVERVQKLSAAEAEAGGTCLAELVVRDEQSGLGGRCLLTLSKRDPARPLPWTLLGVGTPVVVSDGEGQGGGAQRGVVFDRGEFRLGVALNEPPVEAAIYRVDRAADDVAFQHQRDALDQARLSRGDRLAELRSVLLGESAPSQGAEAEIEFLDPGLNESQQAAVRFALSARDVAVLHGPPGTGKTTTVVEVIRQAVRRGRRVLVCAPSNLAVDNLLERLAAHGEKALRLGHPARVLPGLRERALDLVVEDHADVRLARKYVKEAFALFRQANRWTRSKPEPGIKRDQRQEARALLSDARKLENQAVERVLDAHPIVCATTTGLDPELLGRRRFDLAVLDEACQSTEPGSWPPLLRCDRVVLAGDHCQLPPTVLAPEAARAGLSVSLLERLVETHGPAVTRRLDVQYRMHEAIMAFSSREFYDGTLVADEAVRRHLLCDLPGVERNPLTEAPVHFIDTAGAGYDEEREPDGESRLNPQEALLAARKVRALLQAGVAAGAVGVITPYAAQVRRLRELLPLPGLEVDSVDGFQGREKEAIVVSLVRSNVEGEIGFLADVRRTNVALTRARRCLVVVGDSATLAHHPFYERLLEYVEEASAYHTVWEEDV